MKNLSAFLFLAVLALVVSLSSFKGAPSIMQEETRSLPAFTKIGLGYPAEVILRRGNTQSVKLDGDAEQLAQLITEVKDGQLVIKRKDQDRMFNFDTDQKRVTIYITVPQVEALSVSGSGKILGKDSFKATNLELAVSGSGSIKLQASVDKMSSRISGSGNIELEGEGKQSTVAVSGSGSLKGFGFKTNDAKISISGSGSCEINASSTLKSSISGSGRVFYEGQPNVDSRVSGSGKVQKRA
ncbi:head GIN domain-containing protein [Rufibacter radiotolerans]|uniref:head GIN domain-containing protein n=1 Tax=Rufibacter radiotolerans TaxID=1379910 RepID=UPI0006645407|nr:head GIN domain-containing protein [Rufibacter radiotolerans]